MALKKIPNCSLSSLFQRNCDTTRPTIDIRITFLLLIYVAIRKVILVANVGDNIIFTKL